MAAEDKRFYEHAGIDKRDGCMHARWERALGLKPVTIWALGQEADLVKEIIRLSGIVLVFWEHKRIISHMIPAIAAGKDLPGLPSKWNRLRFDVVLRFDRGAPADAWSFRQLFPRLLAGDSDTPLGR
jgi:hypothetical protein